MANDEVKQKTIAERQVKESEALLEQLRKVPVVQAACERAGVSRATYYRWRKEDKEFAVKADEAIGDGIEFISDMSEVQLVSLIKEKKLPAIVFWLRHNRDKYRNRLEIDASLESVQEQLTLEQEAIVKKALELTRYGK